MTRREALPTRSWINCNPGSLFSLGWVGEDTMVRNAAEIAKCNGDSPHHAKRHEPHSCQHSQQSSITRKQLFDVWCGHEWRDRRWGRQENVAKLGPVTAFHYHSYQPAHSWASPSQDSVRAAAEMGVLPCTEVDGRGCQHGNTNKYG